MSNIENFSSVLLSFNSRCHMWLWTWYEGSSESGKNEGRMKETGCCLGFHQFWQVTPSLGIMSLPAMQWSAFSCTAWQSPIPLNLRLPPSASWSSVHCHTVCDGFCVWSPSLTHAIQGSRTASGGASQDLCLSWNFCLCSEAPVRNLSEELFF